VFRKTHHDLLRVIPKHTVAANCNWIRVVVIRLEHMHLHRGTVRPGMHPWSLKSAPPHLIDKTENPVGMLSSHVNQPVSPGFLQGVLRIRTRGPELGSLPANAHAPQFPPNGCGADSVSDNSGLQADLRQ